LRFSGHASLCFVHKCEMNDGIELFILDASCRLGFVETGNNLIMCGKKKSIQTDYIFLNLHILNNVLILCVHTGAVWDNAFIK